MKIGWWLVEGICLFFVIIMVFVFGHSASIEKNYISTENLHVSGNQAGYPTSNFNVSICSGGEVAEKERIEFILENNSDTEWFWRPNIKISGRNGETIDETGLEIELDDIWYDVPLQENVMVTLTKYFLLPNSNNVIPFYVGCYPALIPGKYRYTITIYDDSNKFNLSTEFKVMEGK